MNRTMPKFPTTAAIQLWPFTDFLIRKNVIVSDYLLKHHLPLTALKSPNIKISTPLVYQCIDDIAKNEAIADLGWQVGFDQGAMALGPISKLALQSDSLESGLKAIIDATRSGASHADFFIKTGDQYSYFCHVGGVSNNNPGYYQVETYLAAFMTMLVRQVTGDEFWPKEVLLRSSKIYDIDLPIETFVFENAYTAIAIPNHLLALPFCKPLTDQEIQPQTIAIKLYDTIEHYPEIKALIEILSAYIHEDMPSIEAVAKMGNVSVRAIQRTLAELQLNYTQLIQKLKTEYAIQLLHSNDNSVNKIAKILNYENNSHFIRAFKKQTGITPKQYQLSNA